MRISYLFFLILFVFANGYTENYYVAKDGKDKNSGSESKPWLTVQYAVDNVSAGDTIFVRDGVYNELVTFNISGSQSGGFIVLTNYPAEFPVIDGSGLVSGGDDIPALIKIIDKNYIKVIGFELRNLITSDDSYFPAGIWVRGASNHIELIDNTVHHIEMNNKDAGAHGIAVYGDSNPDSIHNILIDGNEVYSCKLGWSESLVLNGNVSGFVVRNNKIHDNNNIGIDFIGYEGECSNSTYDQARNGEVYDNEVYNIDSRVNPSYEGDASADGYYVDGGRDIIFERNIAHNCNIGFEMASEHSSKTTKNITVRSNIIYENHVIGLAIGGYDSNRGKTSDCIVVNNSFYNNNTDDLGWGAEILVQYYCSNNLFKNNIIYSANNKPYLLHESGTGSNNIFDYNLYYGGGKWSWKGTEYSSLADMQTGSGQEAHSIENDPLFIDKDQADFKISRQSPAIDIGDNLTSVQIGTTDFDSNERIVNSVVDMGAYEYGGVTTAFGKVHNNKVVAFELCQNYPNPFNPLTTIPFSINRKEKIELSVYSLLGQKLKVLISGVYNQGSYSVSLNAAAFSSGIYYYQLKGADGTRLSRKFVVLK